MDYVDAIIFGLSMGMWDKSIIDNLDRHSAGWASPTATDVEWDAIALNYEPECKHKWAIWPFDYNKQFCAYCGMEKRHASNH